MNPLFQEVLDHYIDNASGQVTIVRDGDVNTVGMGNGQLHLGLFATLARFDISITSVITLVEENYNTCRFDLGIFRAHPSKPDQLNSWDNYVGLAAIGSFWRPLISYEIAKRGEDNGWYYNNIPGASQPGAYHDRFPGLVTYYKFCANQNVGVWESLPLFFAILFRLRSPSADSIIKDYMMLEVSSKQVASPFLFGVLKLLWTSVIKRKYGSIGAAIEPYFQPTEGIRHPLVRALL